MKHVAVITGGAGGMGLAVAKLLGRDHHVVISDVNQPRLDVAAGELRQLGISCDAITCDITDRESIARLLGQAQAIGPVRCIIHTAGVSPQMADPATIMKINAVGTINITQAALSMAEQGFALVNVASMAAHLVPQLLIPTRAFKYSFTDIDRFVRKSLFPSHLMPTQFYRRGLAYAVSKSFVIWYGKKMAAAVGEKGARILSVSPGTFDTQMGRLEEKSGSVGMLKKAALKRFGKPEEIAELLAFCASDKASYLTGVDILCDGGVVATKN